MSYTEFMDSTLAPYFQNGVIEAGCDEAGRGCLAGPVVAAAVILDPFRAIEGLNDSKKLTSTQRTNLSENIKTHALAFAIGTCSAEEIDSYNILRASIIAMHRAIDQLKIRPESLLIDGNRFISYASIPHYCIVKGDSKYQSIAAASILAKTYRDEWMAEAHLKYPHYHWDKNMGYPTHAHRSGIMEYGPCPQHRKTFRLLPQGEQLRLDI
jgi:ribonuclease HII